MPPKKKRKLHKNLQSDPDAHKDMTRKEADADAAPKPVLAHGHQSVPSTSGGVQPDLDQQQVTGFVSQQELAKHARTLGLKRVMLADLQNQSDLDKGYVGGQVMAHCSLPYSQGHDLTVFIQDESTTEGSQPKHLRVTVCHELAEKVPTLRDDVKLFLYRAVVNDEDDTCDFSQDHGKRLLMGGTDAQVWIVHKDARKPHFFAETSCGKKWWTRTKQKREKIRAMWSVESVGGSRKEDLAMVGGSTVGSSVQKNDIRNTDSAAGTVDDERESQNSTFPDNSDFPDSAFGEDSVNSPPSSSIASESSSCSDDSDREWTIRQQHNSEVTGRRYEYKKLADLQIGDNKVNTIGVVKEFKPPAVTRGSDYYSTLTLVDESDQRVGVKCIIFNQSPERLPQVKQVGDIVCLHRVNVTSYSCQTQVQGQKYCSAIRFSGDVNKKIVPSTGSVSFTCTLVEKQRVRELREWASRIRREGLHRLESISPNEYFDLVCQIVSLTISKVPRCTIMTVWDATPHTIQCKALRLEKKYEEGYPIVKQDSGLLEDSEGYEAHIVVYNKKCMSKASRLLPGQFVYLQRLHSAEVDGGSGEMELCMHKEDGVLFDSLPVRIEVLDKRDELYRALERRIEQAMSAVTVTRHQNQPISTVAEITSYAKTFPAKFRCRAKVLQVNTPSLEDMVIADCSQCGHTEVVSPVREMDSNGISKEPCSACVRAEKQILKLSHLSCQFYCKITLGDRTGTVQVVVAHDEALQLFNNLKPNNFYQYQEGRYQLMEKLHCLTGGNAPFGTGAASQSLRPRPWVDCCILTAQHGGAVYHCLFDTQLK